MKLAVKCTISGNVCKLDCGPTKVCVRAVFGPRAARWAPVDYTVTTAGSIIKVGMAMTMTIANFISTSTVMYCNFPLRSNILQSTASVSG